MYPHPFYPINRKLRHFLTHFKSIFIIILIHTGNKRINFKCNFRNIFFSVLFSSFYTYIDASSLNPIKSWNDFKKWTINSTDFQSFIFIAKNLLFFNVILVWHSEHKPNSVVGLWFCVEINACSLQEKLTSDSDGKLFDIDDRRESFSTRFLSTFVITLQRGEKAHKKQFLGRR